MMSANPTVIMCCLLQVVIPSSLTVPKTEDGPALSCSSGSLVPKIARTPAGFNCEPLNDQFQVRWAIMGKEIAVELVGLVGEHDWMGFGVSGSTTRTFMLGADPTVVDRYNATYRARDFYLNNLSQCSGVNGVCPDTQNNRTNDVKVGSVSGEQDQGITLVRYIRPLTPKDVNNSLPSDSRIDRSISVAPGVSTYIVWAIGPVSPDTGLPQFHTVYPRGQDFKLEFGRNVTDNCVPLVSNVTVTPPEPYQIPILKDVTEFVARIGPSGGERVSHTQNKLLC
jgi:DOMON domain